MRKNTFDQVLEQLSTLANLILDFLYSSILEFSCQLALNYRAEILNFNQNPFVSISKILIQVFAASTAVFVILAVALDEGSKGSSIETHRINHGINIPIN